jgi:hypothetical protein
MKAIKLESGEIKRYDSLPKSWGNIVGGFNNLSDEELQAYGFYNIVIPEYDASIETLGSLEWDENNSIFTCQVITKTWNETFSELKADKIAHLKRIYNNKLAETDWVIVRNVELNNATDQSILDLRSALRNECAIKEAEINALTTKASVALYSLPSLD